MSSDKRIPVWCGVRLKLDILGDISCSRCVAKACGTPLCMALPKCLDGVWVEDRDDISQLTFVEAKDAD